MVCYSQAPCFRTCWITLSDYLEIHDSPQDYQYLATAMMTGVTSLKRSYYRDGLQKQSQKKVCVTQVSQ